MDEAGFELVSSRKTRKIGPIHSSNKAVALPASNQHITVIACIGTTDAPVPPLILYSGATVQRSWTTVKETDVRQLAEVTESGWTNTYMTKKWMEQAFDPYTCDRVPTGKSRLLIMDGHESHLKVELLEACWDRGIAFLILPANLTAIFQPLDVDFFNQLKMAYHRHSEEHIFNSASTSASKGLFWGWHQKAWRDTATSHQIKGAWHETGLWPLSREGMGLPEEISSGEHTPERQLAVQIEPPTPTTSRIRRSNNNSAICRGVMDPKEAYLKLEMVADGFEAKAVMLEKELMAVRAAQDLDKAARGQQGAQRFPQGQLFDPLYRETHSSELAERKERERVASEKKRGNARATGRPNAQDLVEMEQTDAATAGPSMS